MPRFNALLVSPSVTPQLGWSWYDRVRFILQDCSTGVCRIVLSDGTPIAETGANFILGWGNTVWAYVDANTGQHDPTQAVYHDSFKRERTNTFPFAISPEGDICVKPFSNLGATILHPDGTESRMTDADAQNVQLLSGGRRLWSVGFAVVANFTMKGAPVEDCYGVRCAEDGTALYQRRSDGALVLQGRVVMPGGNYYYPDVTHIDGVYWITWSPSQNDTHAQFLSFTQAQLNWYPVAVPPVVTPEPPEPPDPGPEPPEPPDPGPTPPNPTPEPPPEHEMNLPARCYALMHNGNIASVTPGSTVVELDHEPQEYGSYQEVEVTKSKEWTSDNPRVLVRFTGANRLFRVDKVLALQQKYDQALQTWDPAAADADSVWQQGIAYGPCVHFSSDSKDGQRHGTVYTLTCVDAGGALFR